MTLSHDLSQEKDAFDMLAVCTMSIAFSVIITLYAYLDVVFKVLLTSAVSHKITSGTTCDICHDLMYVSSKTKH